MIRERFIPVTGDDWYRRRRDDAVGRFFRAVSDQGPRKGRDQTRQGLYVLTASGKLLAFRNHTRGQAVFALLERGFELRALGFIEFRPAKRQVTRFDILASGLHWGEDRYTPGARAGLSPLAVAFELSEGQEPRDRVPPQACRDQGAYFRAGS